MPRFQLSLCLWQPTSIFGTAKLEAYTFYHSLLKTQEVPPCEPPYFKFANEASLKQIKATFNMSSIFANDKTASFDFNILMNFVCYNNVSHCSIFGWGSSFRFFWLGVSTLIHSVSAIWVIPYQLYKFFINSPSDQLRFC